MVTSTEGSRPRFTSSRRIASEASIVRAVLWSRTSSSVVARRISFQMSCTRCSSMWKHPDFRLRPDHFRSEYTTSPHALGRSSRSSRSASDQAHIRRCRARWCDASVGSSSEDVRTLERIHCGRFGDLSSAKSATKRRGMARIDIRMPLPVTKRPFSNVSDCLKSITGLLFLICAPSTPSPASASPNTVTTARLLRKSIAGRAKCSGLRYARRSASECTFMLRLSIAYRRLRLHHQRSSGRTSTRYSIL